MTSPESGSWEPIVVTKPTKEDVAAARKSPFYLGYQAGRREFAEALVRAVEDIRRTKGSQYVGHPDRVFDFVLAAISALRSPADTGEPE